MGSLHHVTAMAGDPARNMAFYTGFLGLRLVKRTVNFDDPRTHHLYYGDGLGSPGTLLTFFARPGSRPGRHGAGQAVEVGLAIPPASLGWWIERLIGGGLAFEGPEERFGRRVLRLRDPDGLQLELTTELDAAARAGWAGGAVPAEHAIRGLAHVALWEEADERTLRLLTGILGFRETDRRGQRSRLAQDGGPGAAVEIRAVPGFWEGTMGAGAVHHVAFRAADEAEQARLRETLVAAGFVVTPVRDRHYFRSIYFAEPGGILFEVATDGPGFTVDEPAEALGARLMLPDWLEPKRAEIESLLPPLDG